MTPSPDAAGPRQIGDTAYYIVAILVGAATGVIGTLLHLGVDTLLHWPKALHRVIDDLVDVSVPQAILIAGGAAALAVVLSVWITRTFAPEAGGSGVQEIEGAMEGRREVRWRRVLPVKFCGGLLALGSGLVVGREGPTIHMGASVAQAASETLGLPVRETRGLLAAGAAAGLAAAFSAPLASILFVIEETRRQFPYCLRTYTAVMLASVTSGIVTEELTGRRPFMFVSVPELPLAALPAFVGLGIVLGIVGVGFNRSLVWSMDRALAFGRRTSFYIIPAVVGFVVGILLIVLPFATMGGEQLAVSLMSENLPLAMMALAVFIRFIMTMASYATGVPGGIFAPILALATAIGLLYGLVLDAALPYLLPAGALPSGALPALAVAAMGGLFSATVRAPLVGVVLIAELTGDYNAFVPAIVTCLFANLVADRLGGRPIYEVLLERTLRLAGEAPPVPPASERRQIGGWDQR
ncbi:H(+)/Cl(-) exchange transporter ClcA [Acuticoccus sediminis]|uniref:H(+)/Cl(-) exchange transporter ClcA n=1 Tax=Acuticoccus sediminis TaxID=2184697 RepID=UPI001CFD92AD|nr:H(+)/Cl(-) exchange transporter ClcA [Acuticoccus sediminis]